MGKSKRGQTEGEGKKESVVRGFLCGGVVIASAAGFGAKDFSTKELESAIKLGVGLRKDPSPAFGRFMA